MRIAHRDEPIACQQRQRKRALHLFHRLDDGVLDSRRFRPRVKVENHFRVAARLENRSLAHQIVSQLARVHQIAVVAERNLSVIAVDQDRLRIRQLALASGRVPDMADRGSPRQMRERLAVEHVGDVTHRTRDTHLRAVGSGNACALLAAVLQRVQAEVGHVGRFGMPEDAEDAALFSELVHLLLCAGSHPRRLCLRRLLGGSALHPPTLRSAGL